MMEEFMELLKKKAREQRGPKMDEKMSAKASMAKEISDMLAGDLTEGIKDSKKVMVASNTDEGLKKGLEKAEDVLESKMEDESEEDSESEDESPEMEDDSEVDSKIAKLEEELKKLRSKA